MDSHRQPSLTIEIGGTNLAAALISGNQFLVREQMRTPPMAGPEEVVDLVIAMARRVVAASPEKAIAVGGSCAGVVLNGRVRTMSDELLPGWHDFPLEGVLARQLGLPVFLHNEAQAAAFGEWSYGAAKGRNSMMYVMVASEVGGGIVLGGQLWSGVNGIAGHIGHIHRSRSDNHASAAALSHRASKAGHKGMSAGQVLDAARQGEQWAAAIVRDGTEALAAALADVSLLLDPGILVLGGHVGLDPYFSDTLAGSLDLKSVFSPLTIVPAEMGSDASLIGAAALAYEGMIAP